MHPPVISKSRYLYGLQCTKLLWSSFHARKLFPPVDPATQAIFDQGHLVGRLARTLYPHGILVAENVLAPVQVDAASRAALGRGVPLFEAGFLHEKTFARADILVPAARGSWDIIEVKSSTDVKEINLQDLSLQRYVYEGAGLTIGRCFVMYIDNEYVREGEIEPARLFRRVDATKEVAKLLPSVGEKLARLRSMLSGNEPDIPIGPQCAEPYECALKPHCWAFLPEHHVLTLNHLSRETGFELIGRGILDARDVPADTPLSDRQRLQVAALRSGTPHIDAPAIREFLDLLEYPLHFLDFESFMTAIPLFDGVRPYQQVPFQYSLHVQSSPDAVPEHRAFLAEGRGDPRGQILADMRRHLGTAGSIVAYNAGFEKRILRELVEGDRELQEWHASIEARFVDLLAPFRLFSYYHPSQIGSASIKAVLPALVGKGYEGLDIAEGGMASREFLRVAFGENVDPGDRAKVRADLLNYCKLDTEAMVRVVEELGRITR